MKKDSRSFGLSLNAEGFANRAKKFKGSGLEELIEFRRVRMTANNCGGTSESSIAGEKSMLGKLLSFVCWGQFRDCLLALMERLSRP